MGYKEKIREWLQKRWGEGDTLIDVMKDANKFLSSLPSEAEIAGKLYKEWQQTVVYSLDIKEGQLFDDWLSKEADE